MGRRGGRARSRSVLAALVAASCAHPEVNPIAPPPPAVSRAPQVRVGLNVSASGGSLTLGGGAALTLVAPEAGGGWIGEIPAGTRTPVEIAGGSLRFRTAGGVLTPGGVVLVSGSSSNSRVRLNSRDYRGTLRLEVVDGRINAINLVDLEEYLVGVVGAEMGIRTAADFSAMQAQAIVSRTIALQRIGQPRARAYDLVPTVADQVYGGVGFENELAERAALLTRGQTLSYQGRLIDAFFHSTCGGRTVPGTEVFAAANRPYLRSVSDLDEAGRAWCAISPRYRWRETWTGESLARALHETMPIVGAPAGLATSLRDLRVTERTGTGRVARVAFQGTNANYSVTGPVARLLLRPGDGGLLRSTNFTIQVTRTGDRIAGVVVDGTGAGHGVGMCQWGAIGRSRAGFSYRSILSAYFPGTELSRSY